MDRNASLETLTTTSHELEAEAIVAGLREAGIDAIGSGSFTAGFRAEAPGVVKIMVRREDYPQAMQVLELLRQRDRVDWTQIDVGTPEDE